jgi:RHS repeat-associated protein
VPSGETAVPTGSNAKTVQTEYDGLGRPSSTCALQATGGTSCGQFDGNSGILTSLSYSYSAGGVTTTATRGSQSHITFVDQLGRTKSFSLPESGTTTNYYDVFPAACSGGSSSTGNLVCSVDNAAVQTIYLYDGLSRLTDTNAGGSTCRRYRFDATGNGFHSAPTGYSGTNILGRLMEAETDNCSSPFTAITDEWFAYDADGRVTDVWESTPHSSGWYHTQAGYAVNGQLASISGVPGKNTYTITLDANGRPDSSKDGTTTVASNVTYNGAGQPTEIDYQGSDKDTYTYDANTGLMAGTGAWTFTLGTTTETANLTRNANGTVKTLAITDGFNAGGTQTCHYNPTDAAGSGYDDVGRLVGVNCGTLWTQTYTYDQYDNFSMSGSSNWNPGYNSTVTCPTGTICNHITGGGYDSDGQVTYDLNNSYAWDGYHKMITANAGASLGSCGAAGVTCATYDALGRPVEKNKSGTITELLYSPIGLTAIMSGQTTTTMRVPVPGGSLLEISGSDQIYHMDWLGSARIVSNLGAHTVASDSAYTPYGENYALFGATGKLNFTGDRQDLFSGLYDTPNREFDTSSGSRWLSPDPARASWNAYAYPTNPNSFTDPTGLFPCTPLICPPDPPVDPSPDPIDPGPGDPQKCTPQMKSCGGGGGGGPKRPPTCGVVPLRPCGPPTTNGANNLVPADPCQYSGNALTPADYAAEGAAANQSNYSFSDSLFSFWGGTGVTNFYLNLTGFPRGHYLDPQPFGSGNAIQNAAYGNYVYGVYMQATGVPLSFALSGANMYAYVSGAQYGSAMGPMDRTYGSLPAANVMNITNGYNAQASGTTCEPAGPAPQPPNG